MSGKYLYLPRVRLYSDNERDRQILNWLEGLANGFKGDSIKNAIWANIQPIEAVAITKPKRFTESPPHYQVSRPTGGTMNGSLTLDTRELLADIRQIIEVSVEQGFAHHGGGFGRVTEPEQEDEVEVETLMDNIDMSFMLDDDDEEE